MQDCRPRSFLKLFANGRRSRQHLDVARQAERCAAVRLRHLEAGAQQTVAGRLRMTVLTESMLGVLCCAHCKAGIACESRGELLTKQ